MTDVSLTPVPQPDLSPPQSELETCGSCAAAMASDQRYCLECGQRRGDPRLPFMDAVILMDAVKQPAQAPPPAKKKSGGGISPNAALIAGIGVLLLALGLGVLIGRSGSHEVAQTAAAPQVIKVGGGGSEESAATASKSSSTGGGGKNAHLKSKKQKENALKEAEAHPASEEVLHTAPGVKTPPPTVEPGDKCEQGTAGCEGGKFTGNFFE